MLAEQSSFHTNLIAIARSVGKNYNVYVVLPYSTDMTVQLYNHCKCTA